jgi:hypothetical protein
MLYRIYAFDGLELTRFRTRQMQDNMGTGDALTSYMQLPGGFFDHYGDTRSPQAIRPIVQEGELFADTTAELKDLLFALRSKIGVFGKLTIEFLDNTLYWQWARLTRVDAPSSKINVLSLPVSLTFETSAQIWYRTIVSPTEWTWGDLTWTFGDGTASIGESGTSITLTSSTQAATVTHNGTIAAQNVALTVTPGTSAVTSFQYYNNTTREATRILFNVQVGEMLAINGGNRSAWIYGQPVAISNIANNAGVSISVSTSGAHGLIAGSYVSLSGTAWDGIYKVATAPTGTSFTILSRAASTIAGTSGTVRKLTSVYSYFAATNSSWPTLAPGNNNIMIAAAGNATADAIIGWEFYEHFA